MSLTHSELSQFCGTENWTRWSPLFPSFTLTDGAKYLANKAEAYWLMDAIASHQTNSKVRKEGFQLWVLKVANGKGVLTCQADSDKPALVKQEIFTDFPLNEIKLYFIDGVIMLPSEY